jgi:hypothetical protein
MPEEVAMEVQIEPSLNKALDAGAFRRFTDPEEMKIRNQWSACYVPTQNLSGSSGEEEQKSLSAERIRPVVQKEAIRLTHSYLAPYVCTP